MGMTTPSGGVGGSRRRRKPPMSEINVTPMVDVMLVLLIVFMVTAPLLVAGEQVNLPKTKSQPLPASDQQPLVITVNVNGDFFIGTQKEAVSPAQLGPQLLAISKNGIQDRVLVRGDTETDYGRVLEALSLIRGAGFTNVGLVTDPSGARAPDRES